MHVLQAALSVIGGRHPQELAVMAIPFTGQILHRQPLLQQRQLQVGANEDMQTVAEFIRLHPVAARRHRIQRLPELPR